MSAPLRGRCALVTGGGSGVGAAIAGALAGAGARVAIMSRDGARLERVLGGIRGGAHGGAHGEGEAMALPCDLSDPVGIDRALARLADAFGPPAILVNAAGTFGPIARIEDGDARAWQETLAVNLLGPYLLVRAVLPAMRRAGWGRIINVGSAASLQPPGPLTSAYAVSKAALDRFTRQLASELAGSGLTANVIHPGELRTAMWQDIRARAEGCGADGAGLRAWAELVERSGGDPPRKAGELVLRIIADGSINGRFLWIEDGIQRPLPSWDLAPPAPVFDASFATSFITSPTAAAAASADTARSLA